MFSFQNRLLRLAVFVVSAVLTLQLTLALYRSLWGYSYGIKFVSVSSNVVSMECRFNNHRIVFNYGNFPGPFPSKMTLAWRTRDGKEHVEEFVVSKIVPWGCRDLEFRIRADGDARLLFITRNARNRRIFYDPKETAAEKSQREAGDNLCDAVRNGDIKAMENALSQGADINSLEYGAYRTPLEIAIFSKHFDLARKIIAMKPKPGSALNYAARDAGPDLMEQIWPLGPDIDLEPAIANTPLLNAIRSDKVENVDWLLRHGAKVNTLYDYDKRTPLTFAAQSDPSITSLLLKFGADPFQKIKAVELGQRDLVLITPLQWAKEFISETQFDKEKRRRLEEVIRILEQAERDVKMESTPSSRPSPINSGTSPR